MTKAPLYTQEGVKAGEIDLPESVFAQPILEPLMHEAVVIHQGNQRQGTAMGKNRALVSGGGKKPWKQKGTGHARSGTSTSPLWVRGGKAFAPVPRDYTRKLNRKAKRRALVSAFSLRASSGDVVVFEALTPATHKTKAFLQVLKAAELAGRKLLILTDISSDNLVLASRNIPGVTLQRLSDVSTYEVLAHDSVVLTKDALGALAEKEAA